MSAKISQEEIHYASKHLFISDEEEAKAVLSAWTDVCKNKDPQEVCEFFAAIDLPTKRAIDRILYHELVDVLYPVSRIADGEPAECNISTKRTSIDAWTLQETGHFVPRQAQRTRDGKVRFDLLVWSSSLDWSIFDPQRGIARSLEDAQNQMLEAFINSLRDQGFDLLNFFVNNNLADFPVIQSIPGNPYLVDDFGRAKSELRQRGIDMGFQGGLVATDAIIPFTAEQELLADIKSVTVTNNTNVDSVQDLDRRLQPIYGSSIPQGFLGLNWWVLPPALVGTAPDGDRRAFVIDRRAYGFRIERGPTHYLPDPTLHREGRQGVIGFFPETNMIAVNPAAVVTLESEP